MTTDESEPMRLALLVLTAILFAAPCQAMEPEHRAIVTSQHQERTQAIVALNAYLDGSPLAGYGSTFYDVAQEVGIDYRLSPAIATIESGKGRNCFRSHNAWGWGRESYPDWPTAIAAHVRGIARVYGDTTPQRMNARYCPPNQLWAGKVCAEMNRLTP